MLHRIVSRSVVVLAATGFLASCEDNTAGTPLPPFTPSTAVYVNEVVPEVDYTVEQVNITLPGGVDTTVYAVTPDPVFEVVLPNGDPAVGQVVNFNVNLPGFVAQRADTVDAFGLVSPGRWVLADVCPNPLPDPPEFCRPTQRVIATPVAGRPGFVDVDASFPPTVAPEIRTVSR